MPSMDLQTFYSNPEVYLNYMSCTQYDQYDEEVLPIKFRPIFELMPKFRYKIKSIAGEYYYEEISMEEACDKIFLKTESDDKVLRNQ